jgi:hypothetical protein
VRGEGRSGDLNTDDHRRAKYMYGHTYVDAVPADIMNLGSTEHQRIARLISLLGHWAGSECMYGHTYVLEPSATQNTSPQLTRSTGTASIPYDAQPRAEAH